MLTEGWDTNTVTHILGVRAFGTQLLCEQSDRSRFAPPILRISIQNRIIRRRVCRHHGHPLRLRFVPAKGNRHRAEACHACPRDKGGMSWKSLSACERLSARFAVGQTGSPVHRRQPTEITPLDIGPTSVVMEGITGAGVTITPQVLERLRPSEISFNLAKHLLYTQFRDRYAFPSSIFSRRSSVSRDDGSTRAISSRGVLIGAILYQDQLARAAEKINIAPDARQRGGCSPCSIPTIPKVQPASSTSSPRNRFGKQAHSRRSATSAMSSSIAAGRSNLR